MNRNWKRKELSLMEELRGLELLEEGETVDIPDLEIEDLIEENTLSVIVRCLNPYVHKVGGLVKALPPIWGMEERVRGRGVGEDRAQFIFTSARDLQHVLSKGPWFVNGWMVSMDQWTPSPGPEFLQRIPFWVRIRGLPIHMLKEQVVETLLGPLGKVELVELHAKNSNSLEYVRARVHIHTEEPLQFRRNARFKSGSTIQTELEYEKLLKICFTCKRLTHDQSRCPLESGIIQQAIDGSQSGSKEKVLRKKLQEKELRAKQALQQRPEKGVIIRSEAEGGGQKRGRNKPHTSTGEDKRKGKKIASTPQLVWKQKGDRGGSKVSRSTEESTAHQKSSGEQSAQRSTPRENTITREPPSVFTRLKGTGAEVEAEGSRDCRHHRIPGEDLRSKTKWRLLGGEP
ncbi:Uncharacterized protein Rs2_21169 [Raphanus sativus]|nr:Uncharacterized protein Rs2_21169 [Raphanus sativus]